MTKGYGVSLCGIDNVLKLTVVKETQICDYANATELHTLNVCELYLNKAVKK